jgi:hypothetical protein
VQLLFVLQFIKKALDFGFLFLANVRAQNEARLDYVAFIYLWKGR